MYVKNSNFVIFLTLAAVVGFGLCLLIGGLGTQSELAEGNVAKAARYKNQKEDPMITVIEEKLLNDEEFLNSTKGAMSLLQNRMTVLSGLSEETIAACEGIKEFESLMDEMKAINARAINAATAMENAGKGLDMLAEGKKAPEYEMYSNMAFIGLGKVESQIDLGWRFCETADSFLEGKDIEEYRHIAELAAVWDVFCQENAQMFAYDAQEEQNDSHRPVFGFYPVSQLGSVRCGSAYTNIIGASGLQMDKIANATLQQFTLEAAKNGIGKLSIYNSGEDSRVLNATANRVLLKLKGYSDKEIIIKSIDVLLTAFPEYNFSKVQATQNVTINTLQNASSREKLGSVR